jgi:hypothetical protein
MKSSNLRVMTNMTNLAALDPAVSGIDFQVWPRQSLGLWGRIKAVARAFGCHYVYFDGLHVDALLLLTVKRLLPFNRTRVVVMNLLTTAPQTPGDRRRFAIVAWCLRGAWRIVQYHKDTRELPSIWSPHHARWSCPSNPTSAAWASVSIFSAWPCASA